MRGTAILLLALCVAGVAGQGYQPGATPQGKGGIKSRKHTDEATIAQAAAAEAAVAAATDADAAAALAAAGAVNTAAADEEAAAAEAAAAADPELPQEVVAAAVPVDKQLGVLLNVKKAIDTGNVLKDWTGSFYCSWRGVECDSTVPPPPTPQKVIAINIWSGTGISGLRGKLPTGAVLKGLPSLVRLGIGDQKGITGSIPTDYNLLTNLQELRVANNSLAGPLPPSLGGLKKLKLLYAYDNNITKALPDAWKGLTAMQDLQLSGNQLTGAPPPSWTALKAMKKLYLFGNKLKGPLPDWSGMTVLEELAMYDMELSGALPASYRAFKKLRLLYLYNNYLTGAIPAAWSAMAAMQDFELADNILSGTLPTALGPKWRQLKLLYLYYNEGLGGCLPKEWKTQLAGFDVAEWVYDGTAIKSWCT